MFLSDSTKVVYDIIDDFEFIKNFTLVGGSGLSYYLNHRLSEDLDFFTWESKLRKKQIDKFLRFMDKNHEIKIINESITEIDLLIDKVKVTFFANDWNELKLNRQKIQKNIYVAKIDLLTAMKINTLSVRAKFRDYYDLYVLSKEVFSITEMYSIAKDKIPGMTKKIFAIQISYVEDIDDEGIQHLSPRYEVNLNDIHKYFEKKIEQFIRE